MNSKSPQYSIGNNLESCTDVSHLNLTNEATLDDRVKEALEQIGLEKYSQLFECEEIDYNAFLELNYDDLCSLKIPTGSRKKILSIAKTLRENDEGKDLEIVSNLFSRENQKRRMSTASVFSQHFQKNPVSFGLIGFFVLKVVFVDIFIAFGDVFSDFWQGIELLFRKNLRSYGFLIIAANWLPGIVASIHVLHMYRTKLPLKKTFMYTGMVFILYPILPLLANFMALLKRPSDMDSGPSPQKTSIRSRSISNRFHSLKTSTKEKRASVLSLHTATMSYLKKGNASIIQKQKQNVISNFEAAEYYAILTTAISGGIESPVQFVIQVWLILTGKLDYPWESNWYQFTDWYGNNIYVPTTSAFSLCFSVLAMLKAIIYFNIASVHIGNIRNKDQIKDFMVVVFDHLPFFMTCLTFKVGSILLLAVYLPWGLIISVLLMLICNVTIGYRKFNHEIIPIWLVSCVAVFFPACFTSQTIDEKNRNKMIELQYYAFRRQTISSFLILETALALTIYLINCVPEYNYDAGVVLDNADFNMLTSILGIMGILSCLLSIRPNWTDFFKCSYKEDCTYNESSFDSRELGSIFVRPKSTASAVGTKSILKAPKLSVVTEDDENETSNAEEERPELRVEFDCVDGVTFGPLPSRNDENELKTRRGPTILHILGGLVLTLIILIALLLPLQMRYQSKQKNISYFLYQLKASEDKTKGIDETRIIQGITVNEHNNFGFKCGLFYIKEDSKELESYFGGLMKSKPELNKNLTSRTVSELSKMKIGKDKCNESFKVVMFTRSTWDKKFGELEEQVLSTEGLQALVIVDDNKACANKNLKNCFRPSFPLPDVPSNKLKIPMILLQGVDVLNLYEQTSCFERGIDCEVGISSSNQTIPSEIITKFKCTGRNDADVKDRICHGDTTDKGLLPLDDLIDEHTNRIKGFQRKHVICTWGGNPCEGFSNEDETKPYCDQFDVHNFFCNSFKGHRARFIKKISRVSDDDGEVKIRNVDDYPDRNFSAFSPETWEDCVNKKHIQYCDKNNWSLCTEKNSKSKRRQYCVIKQKQCILEETKIDGNCCPHDSKECH